MSPLARVEQYNRADCAAGSSQVKGNNSPSLYLEEDARRQAGNEGGREGEKEEEEAPMTNLSATASPWVVCAKFGLNLTPPRKRANEKLESGEVVVDRKEPSKYFFRPAKRKMLFLP